MTIYSELFAQLVSTEIDLWNHVDRALLRRTGVSAAQLQALTAVSDRGGAARVQDVSEALQITVGAASKLIDRLERDGLALRSPHPGDRRSMVIGLTPAGERAFQEARTAAESALAHLLEGRLDPDAARALIDSLRSVRQTLSEEVPA